jgi:outer membrane protein assembly factor BamB
MILPLLITLALQDDWLQWRGPRASGSVDGPAYATAWEGPTWKAALPGKGGSTPIVVGDRVVVSAPAGDQDAVLAFDRVGGPLWTTTLGPLSAARHKTLGSSCNASPVSDGKGIFAYFRSGRLAALELDGKVRWKLDIAAEFGPDKLFWDQGCSPVVSGDILYLLRIHAGDSWLAAYDKATGTLRWRRDRTIKAPVENDNGYATPLVVTISGRKALLIWGSDVLSAHDAADGAVIWTCGGFNPAGTGYWPAISTPVVAGDLVVVPAGRDDRPNQARLHGIRLDGTRAWKRDDLGVFVPTPAVSKGLVYLVRHRGEIVCVDPSDGKTLWAEALPRASSNYYASPFVAAGVLYAVREDGAVFAVRVDGGFKLLGESKLGERSVASPVPAGKFLLFRGDAHLFGIAAP